MTLELAVALLMRGFLAWAVLSVLLWVGVWVESWHNG